MNNKYTLEKKTVYTVVTPLNEKSFEDLDTATKHLKSALITFSNYTDVYIAETVLHVPVPQLISCTYSFEYREPSNETWQLSGGSGGAPISKEEDAKLAIANLKKNHPNTQFRCRVTSTYGDGQVKTVYEYY